MLKVQESSLAMCPSRNFMKPSMSSGKYATVFSEVNNHLFCLLDVQSQAAVLTLAYQVLYLLYMSSLLVILAKGAGPEPACSDADFFLCVMPDMWTPIMCWAEFTTL